MNQKIKPLDICVDFDGTCVTHEFPRVGRNIGAEDVLRELIAAGHNLILFTMRSDDHPNPKGGPEGLPAGKYLTDAVNWFKNHNIPLYGIQQNPNQHSWTLSPKAYGQLYIDDAALGIPLKRDFCHLASTGQCFDNCKTCGGSGFVGRPYVCWETAKQLLINQNILPNS